MTVDAGSVHGTFTVTGHVRGSRAELRGRLQRARLAWRGRTDGSTWNGPLKIRSGGLHLRGTLALAHDTGAAAHCGDAYFASTVMPRVLEPICAHCHVPDGLAASAPFRVTVGDPVATVLSARREIDSANPSQSKILRKPRGEISHGGGQQIVPGGPEDQTLVEWVTLVTAPGCGAPGGGPGGGGPKTGASLFADNCASCHGTDARGLAGRPDIHCARSILDAVRNGRNGPAGAMPAFPELPDADVALIQAYLAGLCPTTAVTGAELYAGNCATCHGGDALGIAGTSPAIRCSKRIHDPVRNGAPPMPALPEIPDTEIALIQQFLDGLCPPGTASGVELYGANCALCHGPDAGGDSAPDVRCATRVDDALQLGRGAAMPSFPAIAGVDLNAVEAYLDLLCTTYGRSGRSLYAGNCSTCHGATAHGGRNGLGVRGPDIACTESGDYQEKIRYGGDGMPSFPALTDTDVGAIVTYVRGNFCSGG